MLRQVEADEAPPTAEYFPASQLMHQTDPVDVVYFPATQSLHRADPVDTLYFPAEHCVQFPPSEPEEPRSQVHEASDELPAGDIAFAGHDKHDTDALTLMFSVATENFPGGHSVQEEEPAMSWYEPTPQKAQVLRPDVAENLPSAHPAQPVCPSLTE